MLKGHLPRVIYRQGILIYEENQSALTYLIGRVVKAGGATGCRSALPSAGCDWRTDWRMKCHTDHLICILRVNMNTRIPVAGGADPSRTPRVTIALFKK